MLTMYDNEQYFFQALKAGAAGYVLKSVADRDLVEACRAAMRGRAVPLPGRGDRADPQLPGPGAARRGAVPEQILTAREEEVLKLVAEGHSSKEIAEMLSSASRRSSGTGRTCSRSSACATAWN